MDLDKQKISLLALVVMLFSLLPLSQIAYSQEGNSVAPPAGLISWWPGDGNANDIVGENHGILQKRKNPEADKMG